MKVSVCFPKLNLRRREFCTCSCPSFLTGLIRILTLLVYLNVVDFFFYRCIHSKNLPNRNFLKLLISFLVECFSTIFVFIILFLRSPNHTNSASGLPFSYSLWTDLWQFKGHLCIWENARNTHFMTSHSQHSNRLFHQYL